MARPSAWPVRCGTAPPLTDGFSARPESVPEFTIGMSPGAILAFVPGRAGWSGSAPGWRTSTGKTQLAAYFAESLWRNDVLDLLAWVDASSRASVLAGYAEVAVAALDSDPAGDAESVAARLLSWLDATSRRWLIVLDGVRDGREMAGLWPAGTAGMIVLTANDPAVVPGGHPVQMMPIGTMTARESMSYLRGRLAGEPDLRAGMIDLVSELGGEPMALAQASGVIVSSRLSCRDYLSRFADRREQAARVSGGNPAAGSVTWQLSAEHADWLAGGLAWPILTTAALLDGAGIPGSAFAATATAKYLAEMTAGPAPGHEQIAGTLALLERNAVLEIDQTRSPPAIRVNPLVQSAVLASAPGQMRAAAVIAAADALLEAWPAAETRGWPTAAVRACAYRLWRTAGDLLLADGCHQLLWQIGDSLDAASITDAARMYWGELTAAADRLLGPEHPDTMLICGRLAGACLKDGDPQRAVGLYEHTAERLAARLGPDHVAVITARIDTGRALVAASRPGGAIAMLAEAAAASERLFGPGHPETTRARDELASAFLAAGRAGDAIGLYRRVLAERERNQGARHADTVSTRRKLAAACLADGRFKDAITHSKRVLADRERSLGPDHVETIAARGDLGSVYHSAGRMAAAVQLHEQASDGYGSALGPDHPETLARRANLARAYFAVGRLTDATALLRDVAERCDRVLAPGHPLTQTVRESLGNIAG